MGIISKIFTAVKPYPWFINLQWLRAQNILHPVFIYIELTYIPFNWILWDSISLTGLLMTPASSTILLICIVHHAM